MQTFCKSTSPTSSSSKPLSDIKRTWKFTPKDQPQTQVSSHAPPASKHWFDSSLSFFLLFLLFLLFLSFFSFSLSFSIVAHFSLLLTPTKDHTRNDRTRRRSLTDRQLKRQDSVPRSAQRAARPRRKIHKDAHLENASQGHQRPSYRAL